VYRSERAFWEGYVARELHAPGQGYVCWKVPAELRKGIPDCWFALPSGVSGWLELKYTPALPARTTTELCCEVTLEQLAHLRQVPMRRGLVLWGVVSMWYLLDPHLLTPLQKTAQDVVLPALLSKGPLTRGALRSSLLALLQPAS